MGRPGEQTHLCRHRNKWKRTGERSLGRCQRDVADASGWRYCHDHRDRWEVWWQLRHALPQAAGAPYDSPRPDRAPEVLARPSSLEHAAQHARLWTDTGVWRTPTEQKLRDALGSRCWHRSRRRSTSRLCKQLALQADCLLASKEHATEVVRDLTDRGLAWFIAPRALREVVAAKLAEHIVSVEGGAKLEATAKALRCFGVFICATDDRVELSRCFCLKPLAKAETESKIEEQVNEVVARGLAPLRD